MRPEQVIDYQTLVGDSVDNVRGVEGVGPKTASKYLQDYGTIENLLAHIDDLKGKKKENLQKFLPLLQRSRTLVTLDTKVPMPLEWDKWSVQPWDGPKLLEFFRTSGFRGFAEQVRSTIQSTPVEDKATDRTGHRCSATARFRPHLPMMLPIGRTRTISSTTPPISRRSWRSSKTQKRFAIDLETTSLEPHEPTSSAWRSAGSPARRGICAVRGPSGEPVLDPETTLAHLKPILEDPAIGKVNQNIKYDWQVLLRTWCRVAGVVGDSMVADYLLHAGKRSHNLDALADGSSCSIATSRSPT